MAKVKRKENGTVFKNKHGNQFTIIDYDKNIRKYNCKAVGTDVEVWCEVASINKGTLKHPLDRTVSGVGYIGVGVHTPYNYGKKTRAYTAWSGMISRCYDIKNREYKRYGAVGVTVESNWHNFQKFAEWFYQQDNCNNVDYDVDKDLSNKNLYSQDTCVILHNKINRFISMYFLKRDSVCVYYQGDNKKRASPWRINVMGKHRGSYVTKEAAELDCAVIRKQLGLDFIDSNKELMTDQIYIRLIERIENHGKNI